MTRTRDKVHSGGNGGGVGSLMGRAPPGIPLEPRKMPGEMIIKQNEVSEPSVANGSCVWAVHVCKCVMNNSWLFIKQRKCEWLIECVCVSVRLCESVCMCVCLCEGVCMCVRAAFVTLHHVACLVAAIWLHAIRVPPSKALAIANMAGEEGWVAGAGVVVRGGT